LRRECWRRALRKWRRGCEGRDRRKIKSTPAPLKSKQLFLKYRGAPAHRTPSAKTKPGAALVALTSRETGRSIARTSHKFEKTLKSVRNGTARQSAGCHHFGVSHKKSKKATKEARDATRASVMKEMAKPRMARSARIADLKLNTMRIVERPSTSMPGTVDKLIASTRRNHPEKAQIGVHGADREYRDLRIENLLTDEHGDDVKLKKGAHVEVTVTAEAKT
jgi:hypothetical protein